MAFLANHLNCGAAELGRRTLPRAHQVVGFPRRSFLNGLFGVFQLLLACVLGLAALGAAPAPPKSEAEVKADYLLLFTKYIDWPAEAFTNANQSFVIGVIGDDAVGEALERRVKGRITQGGRKVTVVRARRLEDLVGCHLLFAGPAERRNLAELTGAARSNSTLTVCDAEALFIQGAMIKFVLVEGTVRFEVRLGPVERAGLSVHSGMLGSAKRVWPKTATTSGAP